MIRYGVPDYESGTPSFFENFIKKTFWFVYNIGSQDFLFGDEDASDSKREDAEEIQGERN